VRSRLLVLAAVAVAIGVAAGCGGSSSTAGTAGGTTAGFEGGIISPRRQAPPLVLKDIDGRVVNIRDLRGHPVLVTFVYSHCPDVCPLIMSNLRVVRQRSGALGKRMRVIAVSVDPKGDTPAAVRSFLQARGVAGFVDYLIGSRAQLEPVWAAWQVAQSVPKDNPELVEHSSLIYGVTSSGELATAYPVGFTPAQIAKDLPLLNGA